MICLGSLVADHSFWVTEIMQPPSKNVARAYRLGPGGLAANAAIAVARLGGRAMFWGRLGDDPNAGPLLAALQAEGLDVGGIRLAPGGRSGKGSDGELEDDASLGVLLLRPHEGSPA